MTDTDTDTDNGTVFGTVETRLEDTPDAPGVELPIDDDIVDILDIEPGDEIEIEMSISPDGTVDITGELVDVDELTAQQREALLEALPNSNGT